MFRESHTVTRRDRAWVLPSIQVQTTLFQRRGTVSNIASKCPETRAMQPARKRSDRTSPSGQAGERLLQPLFCGAPQGLVASVDLKDAYFHIHSTASQMLSEVCSRWHSFPVPCSPVWAGFGPVNFLEVHGCIRSQSLRANGMRVFSYLDDWLVLATSLDTPASHIEKQLSRLEFLRLCVSVLRQK